ncbi:MAG: FAD-dependent oxidoreductase [Actinomycetota bacterium]
MHAMIAGGGIAGPVTAMALQRVGIEATVYESHPPADPEVGSFFVITANGLAALTEIDAAHLVEEVGFPTRRTVLWSHTGRRLASMSLDSRRPDSHPAHTVKRSRLVRLLQEEAERRGIRIEYGRRLIDARDDGDGGVEADFADGSTAAGDALIGCDGIHSAVRRLIDPNAPAGRYVGLTNFGGVTRGAAGGIEPGDFHMSFGRRAFFGHAAAPDGDVVWFVNHPRPLITAEERRSITPAEWKRLLADLFQGDAGPATELIEAGDLELYADNTHDLGHVPTWHRGPMVIIGDAAHAPSPSSGQGASLAMEDGIVLARALGAGPSVSEAFTRFEELRRDRVEKVVAWGAKTSNQKAPGPVGRLVRDLFLPLVLRFFVTDKSVVWMYDYRVGEELAAEFS